MSRKHFRQIQGCILTRKKFANIMESVDLDKVLCLRDRLRGSEKEVCDKLDKLVEYLCVHADLVIIDLSNNDMNTNTITYFTQQVKKYRIDFANLRYVDLGGNCNTMLDAQSLSFWVDNPSVHYVNLWPGSLTKWRDYYDMLKHSACEEQTIQNFMHKTIMLSRDYSNLLLTEGNVNKRYNEMLLQGKITECAVRRNLEMYSTYLWQVCKLVREQIQSVDTYRCLFGKDESVEHIVAFWNRMNNSTTHALRSSNFDGV